MALLLGLALYASDAVGQQARVSTKPSSSEPGRSPPTLTLALGARPLARTMEWPYLSQWAFLSLQLVHPSQICIQQSRQRYPGRDPSSCARKHYLLRHVFGERGGRDVDASRPYGVRSRNWNGTDQKRLIGSLTADELKYTNPAASVGGTAELTWKRVQWRPTSGGPFWRRALGLPTVMPFREFVEAGSLISYGANIPDDLFRRAGQTTSTRFCGAPRRPILPVEQPTKFDLVVNLTTARALGARQCPPTLLARADEVIE